MAGFMGIAENTLQAISRGFIAQFDTASKNKLDASSLKFTLPESVFSNSSASPIPTAITGGFSGGITGFLNPFAKGRKDHLPEFPIIMFDYEPQFEFSFKSVFTEIGTGSTITPTKVLTKAEYPKVQVSFFLDISKAQEQPFQPKNTTITGNAEAKVAANNTLGALGALSSFSLNGTLSQFLGGFNPLDTGIQPILDKYIAMASPDFAFNGQAIQYPCIMCIGLNKFVIGYVIDLNYRVLRTSASGAATRASGTFTFERHPLLEYQKLETAFAGLSSLQKVLSNISTEALVFENGIKLITQITTGGSVILGN